MARHLHRDGPPSRVVARTDVPEPACTCTRQQSEGFKTKPGIRSTSGMYRSPTIFEHLARAGRPAAEYFTNLPIALLLGLAHVPVRRTVDAVLRRRDAGTLPNVTFVTPRFGGPFRTDDHPRGDIEPRPALHRSRSTSPSSGRRSGSAACSCSCTTSGVASSTTCHPPTVPDSRVASSDDLENFGQSGSACRRLVASPYARRGYVDHGLYDHTSDPPLPRVAVPRRPAQGPGQRGDTGS